MEIKKFLSAFETPPEIHYRKHFLDLLSLVSNLVLDKSILNRFPYLSFTFFIEVYFVKSKPKTYGSVMPKLRQYIRQRNGLGKSFFIRS